MNFKEFKNKFEHIPVEEYPNFINKTPLVSICVQTYQHKNYITNCLDGILKQKTNFPFEILLGEDASTDGTREICLDYAKKYPNKIKLFLHHRENNIAILGTPTGRFNFMYNIYSSKGDYIAFCEGDDFWDDPFKLQTQVDFLKNYNDYVLTYHDAKVIDVNNIVTKESKLKPENKRDYFSKELQKGAHAQTLTMCFRNVINEFPSEFFKVINADTFLISILGGYGKGKYMNVIEPACYRMHNGGVWSIKTRQKFFKSRIILYSQLMKYYQRIDNIEMKLYFNLKLENIYLGYLEYAVEHRNLSLIKENSFNIFEHTTGNKFKNIRNLGKYYIKGILKILNNERHVE